MSAASVAPVAITQGNCLAAIGIEPRRFLALIHERSIPHVKLGKLRLVRVEHLLAAIEAAPEASEQSDAPAVATQASRLERAAGLA